MHVWQRCIIGCLALLALAPAALAAPSPATDPAPIAVVTSSGASTKPVWIEGGKRYKVSKAALLGIGAGTAPATPAGTKIVGTAGVPGMICGGCDPGGDTCGQYQGYNNGGSWLNPDHVWNQTIVCWNQGGPPAGSGNWQISGVGGWVDTRAGLSQAVCYTQWWAFWEAAPWQAVSRGQAGFAPTFHSVPLCPSQVVITASLRAYWSPGNVAPA